MLKKISKDIVLNQLFQIFLIFAAQNAYAADLVVDTESSSQQTFTEDNQTLFINSGGNLTFSGAYGSGSPFNTSTNQINLGTRASIGVYVGGGVSGAAVTIDTQDATKGIRTSIADKGTGSIVTELGSTLKKLELKSGTINSTDTAIFLRDSNSEGTDIIIREGAIIQGSRYAIRYDNAACIDQDPTLSGGDTNSVSCSGSGNYNSFTGSTKAEAEANAEAAIIGNLKLRITNEGIIAANPRLTANPGVKDSMAFYSSGNSRIKSDVEIANEATGKIYGQMAFGNKVFSTTYNADNAYITSKVSITNSGLISSNSITSDFNTTLNILNKSTGIIRIETSPIAGSDGVEEEVGCSDASDPTCNYDVLNGTSVSDPKYYGQTVTTIRPQGENSTITNYGTIIGTINTSLKSQTVNLNGGQVVGNIQIGGTLNFSNDFGSDAVIGTVSSVADRKTGETNTRINIGTKTYNIADNISDGGTLAGSLNLLAGTGDHPIISTTFTDGGALGRINFTGATKIETGVRLNINIADNYSYLKSGTDYLVIDGDSKNTGVTTSDVNAVADSSISINDGAMGNNKIGILTFHSAARDYIESTGKYKDLVVYIDRLSAEEITDDKNAKEVFEEVNEVALSNNYRHHL